VGNFQRCLWGFYHRCLQRTEQVAPHVANLVFDVAFLMASVRIAEGNLEAIMRFESQEHFSHSYVLADAAAYTAGIIEDESRRDAAYAIKQIL
jgi:hypothetical protein